MQVVIKEDVDSVIDEAVAHIQRQVRLKRDSSFSFASGHTMLGIYAELVAQNQMGKSDFSGSYFFQMNEFWGLTVDNPQSFSFYQKHLLLDHLKVEPSNTHWIPDTAEELEQNFSGFEMSMRGRGGVDLCVLGLGENAQIAYNEPGSSLSSRCRVETLTEESIQKLAQFFPSIGDVPRHVITQGIGTILESKVCLVVACGEQKAKAVASMVEGPVSAFAPASALQFHPRITVIVDEAAASKLMLREHYEWVNAHRPEFQK